MLDFIYIYSRYINCYYFCKLSFYQDAVQKICVAICCEVQPNNIDSIERNVLVAHCCVHWRLIFLRFEVKNINLVPVEIEKISAVNDLKRVSLEILGDALKGADIAGSLIIKKKHGIQYLLEDKLIDTLVDVNKKKLMRSVLRNCVTTAVKTKMLNL